MKRTHWVRGPLTLAAAFTFAAAGPALADQADFRWNGHIEAGQSIEIIGVQGDIEALPTSNENTDVRARKRGRRSDPSSVEIRVVEHDEGVTICAVYPTPRDRGDPNDCRPGGDASSVRRNDVTVRFAVRVPEGVNLIARTVNGDVEVGDLSGEVTGRTVNGDVDIRRATFATGATVNGSIDVEITDADWPDDAEFRTVNGGVTITLPATVNADLDIRTVNGSIDSDFPLTLRGRIDSRHIRGSLGDGGPELEIETVNGSIRIRSRRRGT